MRNPDTASKASASVGSTVSPRGCVTVDTGQGKLVPLRGAKVRCRTFLREAEAILSDDGRYSFGDDEYFIAEPTTVHLKIMVKYGQICTLGGKRKLQMIDF